MASPTPPGEGSPWPRGLVGGNPNTYSTGAWTGRLSISIVKNHYERVKAALADRYALVRELGRGGAATVYVAKDLKHNREVAVKVLRPELTAAVSAERFLREIEIAANLSHPHILPVYDSGTAGGVLYYVMPLVEGESLRARINRETQLPLEDALKITREVADALGHAHSYGVVHRDVKPENILLSGDHAIIADFGVARAVEMAGTDRLTETGLVVGTPAYMSPEQASGDSRVDGRADLYSLACVLYEMVGGEPPHSGPTPQAILARQLTGEVRSLRPLRSTVSPALDRAIRRALAPAAADRYPTASDFVRSLAAGEAEPTTPPARPVGARLALGVVGALVLGAVAYVGLGRDGAVSSVTDDRLAVAVFPFRPTDADAAQWSEQVPDLLATVLDGTPEVRVADPWSLWRTLRPERTARAVSPVDPLEASEIAGDAGADRFVLGTVTDDAGIIRLNVRVYRAGVGEPLRAFLFDGPADSLGGLVQRLAVAIIGEVFPRRPATDLPGSSVAGYGTQSADALKSYLRARDAMRRGQVDEADAAIDQAVAADSTFALALVEATTIKSWVMFLSGEFFRGLMELAERAVRYSDSLSERNRLRARSALASIRTDGITAAEAATRIVQIDSSDVDGWRRLAYYQSVYGWQFGADEYDAVRSAERAVQLDSTFIPSLLSRAWLSVTWENPEDIRVQMVRLGQVDTTNALVRATLIALRGVLADDREFDALADTIGAAPFREWLTAIRYLRSLRPSRAEAVLDRLRGRASPGTPQRAVLGEIARLKIAEGRIAEVDSGIAAGDYEVQELYKNLRRFFVAASIAGVGDPAVSERAVAWLEEYVPPDSALHYFETRPVWWTLWLVGAYHATVGDTLITQRWKEAIGTLPAGGTSSDYRGGLQADLDARVAARRGDLTAAVPLAERAVHLWSIHTDNDWEALAAPAMRFHLAMLMRATGRPDSAEALLHSLVPPTTWMGFYTARASYELGQLAEAREDFEDAARYYLAAVRLWERGGAEVREWREQATQGLRRVVGRRG